jgi:uncharacterized protein YbcV (DUF1398 family)
MAICLQIFVILKWSRCKKLKDMFKIDQIKSAHSKVKSGADYPAYVQELIKIGVIGYETYVSDGNTTYFGANHYRIESGPKYDALVVSENSDTAAFKRDLKAHQEGKTNFPRFCLDAARSGVEKWVVSMDVMTCTYLDKNGQILVTESIPGDAH